MTQPHVCFECFPRKCKSVSKNSHRRKRHALGNSKLSYWNTKVINLSEKTVFEGAYNPGTVACWEVLFFLSTALPTKNSSTVCVSDMGMCLYQQNAPCLSYRVLAWCGFCTQLHSSWTCSPVLLTLFFFLYHILIHRVHLLNLFIGGVFVILCKFPQKSLLHPL